MPRKLIGINWGQIPIKLTSAIPRINWGHIKNESI
jgi:hypothetical protein